MAHYDFWDYVLRPTFLFTFLLTLGTFAPIAWSIFITWQENKDKERRLLAEQRRQRRARWARKS